MSSLERLDTHSVSRSSYDKRSAGDVSVSACLVSGTKVFFFPAQMFVHQRV